MKKIFIALSLMATGSIFATNYYVRTNTDASSWNNLTSVTVTTLAAGDVLPATISGDDIYYLAPGTYNTPLAGTIVGNSNASINGKIYGGFSGTETAIDLTSRATNDKDQNGIIEPWEFTNVATITTSSADYKFSSTAGVIDVAGLLVVSGAGAEVNGVTITDFFSPGLTGPICLGKQANVQGTFGKAVVAADNIANNAGILRKCIVKKIKGNTFSAAIMLTNQSSLVDNCLIQDNVSLANSGGGAVYMNVWGGKVTGCVIRNNASVNGASTKGAGILANSSCTGTTPAITNTDLNAIVENCVLYNNYCDGYGSAIRGEGTTSGTKHGIQIINCTVVNNMIKSNTFGYGSVELTNSGLLVNSIVTGDTYDIRPCSSNNFISSVAYGIQGKYSGTLYPLNGTDNVGAKIVSDFSFQTPTTFTGVMNPDYTPTTAGYPAFDQAKYDAICKANFKLTSTSSVAVTNNSLKMMPATYSYSTFTITITASVPTRDLLGADRPVLSSGHYDLGAYQYSSLGTSINSSSALSTSNIYGVDHGIIVNNARAKKAFLYNVSGQLVKSVLLSSDNATINANRGFYLVKVGASTTKVLVK